MNARDLGPAADWYGDMQNDAAFLGDLDAEQRRFNHEARKADLPQNMGAWMREQLDNPTPEQLAKRKRLADLFDSFEAKWAADKQKRATSPALGIDSPKAADVTAGREPASFSQKGNIHEPA